MIDLTLLATIVVALVVVAILWPLLTLAAYGFTVGSLMVLAYLEELIRFR